MAKIYAPNKAYTGVSASVSFVGGIGESDNPALLEWFRDHGYTVEEPEVVIEPPTIPEPPAPPKEEEPPVNEEPPAAEEPEAEDPSTVEEPAKEAAPVEAKKTGQKGAKHA